MPTYRRPQPGSQPPYRHPSYVSSLLRAPNEPQVLIPQTVSEVTGPRFDLGELRKGACDLTRVGPRPAIGERIVVSGQVLDEDGRPMRHALIEIWQANSAGRYRHDRDQHEAPLDPNFTGSGRTVTDESGHYRFVTIKP